MFTKIINFIKYNNATVIILAIVLILGGGALAAGPDAIGGKQTSVQGVDNAALLAVDLNAFNMDFKIENIEQDAQYYYVTYSFLDLALIDNAWQYQLSQKTQKISKKIKEDVGVYMAKFMSKHHEARVRELTQEKSLAQSQGEQKRVEVTEYSGLIGKTLDLAAAVFPGYEPVVKTELPTPENFNLPENNSGNPSASSGQADNLTQIYNDYIAEHPEIFTTPTPVNPASTTPNTVAPEIPTVLDQGIQEPTSVNIIDLPTLTPVEPVPAEPTPVTTPAPVEPAPAPTENSAPTETPAQ